MAKVKLGLDDMTVPEKIPFNRTVVTSMTGNSNYVTPNPPLADVTAKTNTMEQKYQNQQTKIQAAEQATAELTIAERDADQAMTQLGTYVENTSNGDAIKIQSAGMQVRSDAAPIGQLPAPASFVATVGDNDGYLDTDWDSMKGAKSYELQRSPDPITPTSWTTVATVTKSKATVTGNTSGVKYWFRVRAIATAGPSPWSDPATKIAP